MNKDHIKKQTYPYKYYGDEETLKKLINLFSKNKISNKEEDIVKPIENTKLPRDIEEKISLLRPYIQKNSDIVSRPFCINGRENLHATVIYIEGVIDTETLNQDILKPIMLQMNQHQLENKEIQHFIDRIYQTSLTVGQIKKIDTLDLLIQNIFDGLTILMFDGYAEVLVIDIRGGEIRAISEPETEKSIRGSREGFVENLVVNVGLIRRKLRDPNLVVEKMIVGKRSRTDVAILYIKDIADPKIVVDIKEKIQKIEIDGILATGYIEQLIEENPYSFFPQIQETERPDKVAAHLLEGKIAIIANGTPFVLILPSLFVQFLQTTEDYFDRTYIGSVTRVLRHIAFFLAIFLPGIYVALLSFQQELIPFDLIVSLASSRKDVPFPVAVEALLQEFIIKLLTESGLRLPTPLGQTVGVVGGIILGQAAISAKLASPAIIIVTAITTICTWVIPTPSMANTARILRLPVLLCASFFGLFGLSLCCLIILAHLSDLESLGGVPYFAPYAPTRYADLKDSFFRTFLWKMKKRPASIPGQDKQRQTNTNRKETSDER